MSGSAGERYKCACWRGLAMNCMTIRGGGLDLPMGVSLNAPAYLCVDRWVQGECRGIGEFDAPEVDGALQAAVSALRERPVLFKYCAEEVATARHSALFQVGGGKRVKGVLRTQPEVGHGRVDMLHSPLGLRYSSASPRSASLRRSRGEGPEASRGL